MPGKSREIKTRMKAVGNIQRITKTMQLIATARFQTSQRRAVSAKPYTRKIQELVGELSSIAGREGGVKHPLLAPPQPPVGRELILVITSNRGLCGGYNASILRTAAACLRDLGKANVQLEVVGKKGGAYFKFQGVNMHAFHSHFTDKPTYEQVEELADRYMAHFTAGKFDAIKVVYMQFLSASRQAPTVLSLLPLKADVVDAAAESANVTTTQYEFSPDAQTLLSELLPITVKVALFQAFNEAIVSEQVSRMVAMKSATDAAGKMKKNLTRRYNRARQTSITTELSEIIAGSAALA
jgi:F-type H+-transporting ATPase subunit gamma